MKTVLALYDNMTEAQHVVQDLVDSGFDRDQVSLVANDASGEYKTMGAGDEGAADGAATGAGVGAVGGGVLGLLAGLGALAIPGIGPIVAAGPIMGALAGAGVGAATGGLVGALVDLGVPDDDAGYYAEGIRRGGTLVTVRADDNRAQLAADIMNRHAPVNLDQRVQSWQQGGWSSFDADAGEYDATRLTEERTRYSDRSTNYLRERDVQRDTSTNLSTEGQEVIPVVEEEIRVGKRTVQRGGVRINTHVEEIPVEEQVTLREERVVVDRRPVNRAADEGDFSDALTSGVIEVTETSEEAVVDKQSRVVEEVVVRKDVDTRTETIRDTVRRTDVDVEEMGMGTRTSGTTYQPFESYSSAFRSDFDSNYARSGSTYEQYQPAYRYGYDLASSGRYTGRSWNDVEMDARRDWETHNQGTWEEFKGAVRRGWEGVTGQR